MHANIQSDHPRLGEGFALLTARDEDALLELLAHDSSLAQAVDLDKNWTLLHAAGCCGSHVAVTRLLAVGADPNAADNTKGRHPCIKPMSFCVSTSPLAALPSVSAQPMQHTHTRRSAH